MRKRKVWAQWENDDLHRDVQALADKYKTDHKQLARHIRTIILGQ